MSKFIVLAVLIAAAYAQATANDCNGASCTANGCMYGQTCCSGKCYGTYSVPGTLALGATGCVVPGSGSQTCSNLCAVGTCVSGTCTLPGIGPQCSSTACSTSADCAFGQTCIGTQCGPTGLLPGAPCGPFALCASGFSCVSNVCTASTVGQNCTLFSSPVTDYSQTTPYAWTSNCTKTATCLTAAGAGGSFGYCITPIVTGQPCLNNLASSCASGICQQQTGGSWQCIAAASQPLYAPCANDGVCVAGSFCNGTLGLNGYCVPSWPAGVQCTRSTQCGSSAYCSHNSTTGLPNSGQYNCLTGTKWSLAAGATCMNSDQCGVGMNCTYTTIPWQGTCTSVIGQPCNPSGVAPADCHSNPDNNVGVLCTCISGTYRCTTTPSPSATPNCATTYNNLLTTAQGGFGNTGGSTSIWTFAQNILLAGSDANRAVAYAFFCCNACSVGLSAFSNQATGWQQILTLGYNCKTAAYATLTGTDLTTRCTKSGTTAIATADQFGTCPTNTPGAASIVSPSLALLFSIVALVFLL